MEEHGRKTGMMEDIIKENGDTWPKILEYNFRKYGNGHKAMRHKYHGIWRPYTWEDYYLNVKKLALGLLSLGVKPDDKVVIMGDNAPEYYFSELAIQAVHGVSVGIYSELNPQEIKYICENSGAVFAIVEDQEQVDKFLEIKNELQDLKNIIYWNNKGLAHYNDTILMDYNELTLDGLRFEEKNPNSFERNIETGRADDVCTIIYSPGTSGNKLYGSLHTFKTLMTGASYNLRLEPWHEKDNLVPYIPPAWISEQLFGIGCHLLSACTVNFPEAPETFQRDVEEISPSIVIYGARVWESQIARVKERILDADALKRFVFNRFMPVGYRMADLRRKKEAPGILDRIIYSLSDLSLLKPVKKSLGLANARICYSTGQILDEDAIKFYHALNLHLKSLYISTEGGSLTGVRSDNIEIDTAGVPHHGVDIKVTDRGEIIYKHPGLFIGYHRDPEKTAESIRDGWFYSGDKGDIRDNGHLKIIDRMEDIVLLYNGEELAPQFIESRLRSSPYIKDAWVISGPDNEYVSAIIIINYQRVSLWAGQRRLVYSSYAELSQMAEVYDLIKSDISKVNSKLRPGLRIKKFANLHKELDPDKGELTRTMKLRRSFLTECYKGLIEAIYHDRSEMIIEDEVRSGEGQVETIKSNIVIKSINEESV